MIEPLNLAVDESKLWETIVVQQMQAGKTAEAAAAIADDVIRRRRSRMAPRTLEAKTKPMK